MEDGSWPRISDRGAVETTSARFAGMMLRGRVHVGLLFAGTVESIIHAQRLMKNLKRSFPNLNNFGCASQLNTVVF